MSAAELEGRSARVEDLEAIKKLKTSYWLHVNNPNQDGYASLLSEDAVWESDKYGRFEARELSAVSSEALPRRSTSPFITE